MADAPLTYAASGVDIDEAQRTLRAVTGDIRSTHTAAVLGGVGGFGGLFRASFPDMVDPVLVSSIDGVGTKTKIAAMVGRYDGLGADIVNHCANDVLCQGARPLFFLDYFGCSRLNGTQFEPLLAGMSAACREVGAALVGGETAEMPGVYHEDEIDVVGAIVGVVDESRRQPCGKLIAGDAVIGIASSGLHTNGYSLARRALFDVGGLSVRDAVPGLNSTIGDELVRPHRCYVNSVLPILEDSDGIRALAHITGGGLYDNIPRVLSSGVRVIIERRAWTPLPIFSLIQETGHVPDVEMYRAFNMGIGMVLLVDRDAAAGVLQRLNHSGEHAAIIGEVQAGAKEVQLV